MVRTFLLTALLMFVTSSCSEQNYNNYVVPINNSGFNNGAPRDSVSLRWRRLLNFTCDDILNNWWSKYSAAANHKEEIDFGYLENNSKTGEFGQETKGGIRPAAQAAYSLAVALFTNAYDSSLTNVANDKAKECALIIMKSLAKDHMANEGIDHPWGDQWQSAQWASKTAVSGWILWDYLDESDRRNIARMIEFEANRFLDKIPSSANENYVKDTHAEENGWDATGIQTACALLPQHENYDRWYNKLIEYRLNALAIPSDSLNEKLINNRIVKDCVHGYNIDSLGAAGNHGAYPHPDYMAAPLRHTIEGALFFKLAGIPVPEANSFNCDLVYQNYVDHVWNNESTIYKKNGSIYWPIDIENDRRFEFITFGILDMGAQLLGFDNLASVKGDYWENLHTQKAIEMKLTGFVSASAYLYRWLEHQEN